MRTLFAISIFAIAMSGACKKKDENKTETPAPAPTPTEPAQKAPEPAKPEASTMPNKQKNCPNTVEGAKTEVSEADGAVVVTVSAEGDAVKEIQARAKVLAAQQGKAGDKVEHTGEGTGGQAGPCPAFIKDSDSTFEDTDTGIKVTMKPKAGGDVAAIKTEVDARMKKMEAGDTGKGDGDGDGDSAKPADPAAGATKN